MSSGNLIVYTSDLHGDERQYVKLFSFAEKAGADTVVIGGDILPSPRLNNDSYVPMQRDFLKYLGETLIDEFRRCCPSTKVFMMPGNKDSASLSDIMEKYPSSFRQLHWKRYDLKGTFYDIAGYSFVPETPFCLKDWEKPDTCDEMGRMRGFVSSREKLRKVDIEPHNTIEDDMKDQEFYFNSFNTLYFFHSPPINTNLDLTKEMEHVGSKSIRRFIEENNPPITFHGHIHETVNTSESFVDRIGDTFCFSAGNDHRADKLAVIVLNSESPNEAERRLI